MKTDFNWLGLAGGICIIVLIIASMFVPWWQLTVGEDLIQANWSPLNTNFNFAGDSFSIPLVMALNISSIILLAAGGIVMLIYSVFPRKPYAKKLLGFAYRKPLYALLFFLIGLFAVILLPKSILGLDVPISGSVRAALPSTATPGITVSILMTAGFQWTFALAIVATGLCIAARLYHVKFKPTSDVQPVQTPAAAPSPPAPPVPVTTPASPAS